MDHICRDGLLILLVLSTASCDDHPCTLRRRLSPTTPGHRLECHSTTNITYIAPVLSVIEEHTAFIEIFDSPDLVLRSDHFNNPALNRTEMIHLIRCGISRFDPAVFAELSLLESLWIESNTLTDISSRSLSGLEHLKDISFKDNRISYIASDAFRKMTNLNLINLSYNKLKLIPDGLFMMTNHVIWMSLKHNELTSVNDLTFRGLMMLTVLDLSENMIGKVSRGGFQEMEMLEDLYLRSNRLEYLFPNVFETNGRMRLLDIMGNDVEFQANFTVLSNSQNDVDR